MLIHDWNLHICLFTVLEIIAIGHFLTDCMVDTFSTECKYYNPLYSMTGKENLMNLYVSSIDKLNVD